MVGGKSREGEVSGQEDYTLKATAERCLIARDAVPEGGALFLILVRAIPGLERNGARRLVSVGRMSFLKAACQHCCNGIEFPEHGAGSEIDCPHCGKQTLLLPLPKEAEAVEPEWMKPLDTEARQGPPALVLTGGCPGGGSR